MAGENILQKVSETNLPDLQSPCAEDTSPFVLCQVPRGYADLVRLTFALLLWLCDCALTVCHLLVTTGITIGLIGLARVLFAIYTSLFALWVVSGQEVVSIVLFFSSGSIWRTRRKCVRVTNKSILCEAEVCFSDVDTD